MKIAVSLLLTIILSGCSLSIEETSEANLVATATSLNGNPIIYLKSELDVESLAGLQLSYLDPKFDPQKSHVNEKNLKKDSKTYYLVTPSLKYVLIDLEDGKILEASDHGKNGSSILMKAMMEELGENQAVEATSAKAPVASP